MHMLLLAILNFAPSGPHRKSYLQVAKDEDSYYGEGLSPGSIAYWINISIDKV